MNLSSNAQSLIAGALIDFMGHLTTLPRTIRAGGSVPVYDLHEELIRWAARRQLDLDGAEVEDWSTKKASQITLEELTGSRNDIPKRIAGALLDFVSFAKKAGDSNFENLLLRWATFRKLELHDPQMRWSAIWWG